MRLTCNNKKRSFWNKRKVCSRPQSVRTFRGSFAKHQRIKRRTWKYIFAVSERWCWWIVDVFELVKMCESLDQRLRHTKILQPTRNKDDPRSRSFRTSVTAWTHARACMYTWWDKTRVSILNKNFFHTTRLAVLIIVLFEARSQMDWVKDEKKSSKFFRLSIKVYLRISIMNWVPFVIESGARKQEKVLRLYTVSKLNEFLLSMEIFRQKLWNL